MGCEAREEGWCVDRGTILCSRVAWGLTEAAGAEGREEAARRVPSGVIGRDDEEASALRMLWRWKGRDMVPSVRCEVLCLDIE